MNAIRSCHELGVCHGRASAGCSCNRDHKMAHVEFAPGVIQTFPPNSSERRRWLVREALVWMGMFLVGAAGTALIVWVLR